MTNEQQDLPLKPASPLAPEVEKRLADFAHECNVNAGFALPKPRTRSAT